MELELSDMSFLDNLSDSDIQRIAAMSTPRDRAALRSTNRKTRRAMREMWPLTEDELKTYLFTKTPRELVKLFEGDHDNKILTRRQRVKRVQNGRVSQEWGEVAHPLVQMIGDDGYGLEWHFSQNPDEGVDEKNWLMRVLHQNDGYVEDDGTDNRVYGYTKQLGLADGEHISLAENAENPGFYMEEQNYNPETLEPKESCATAGINASDIDTASESKRNQDSTKSKINHRNLNKLRETKIGGLIPDARSTRKRANELWVDMVENDTVPVSNQGRARGSKRCANAWARAVSKARQHLGIQGFEPIRRGSALHREAKRIVGVV